MSAATSPPRHSQHLLTPPRSAGATESQDPTSERGRKRRRSSAANQASQLPSNTLRGRGRRRSSSLHLTATTQPQEFERHRSRSPDRRSHLHGKEGQAKMKYVKTSDVSKIAEEGNVSVWLKDLREFKKKRDQSPSRSRSHGHEGDVKARRRQRTRSRSRSHGRGEAEESAIKPSSQSDGSEEDEEDEEDDENNEVAVED